MQGVHEVSCQSNPGQIMEEYSLLTIVHKDHVYAETVHSMYGLPQVGHLTNKLLAQRLAKDGYYQDLHTPGLWEHTMCPIQFALIVDDFCVKYGGCEHAEHLLAALKEHYTMTTDWKASLFCSIWLQWDCDKHMVKLSMPRYVETALHKFQHLWLAHLED